MLQAIAPTAIFRNGVYVRGGTPFGINPDEVEAFKGLGYKIIGEDVPKEKISESETSKPREETPKSAKMGTTKKAKSKTSIKAGE